jgi:ribosomal protein S27E
MNKHKLKVRCLDCGTSRYVSRHELNRAARVRCLGCGGPTELTREGNGKLAEGQDAHQCWMTIAEKKQSLNPKRH